MRTFPKVYQEANGLIRSDDMNRQVFEHLGTINGELDGENLPDNVLVAATTTFDASETTVVDRQITHTFNAFKATAVTSTVNYTGFEMRKSYTTLMTIDMDTTEGTLVGSTNCTIYAPPYQGSGVSAVEMTKYRIGVFINGMLVSETDNITEERHSVCLPFSANAVTGSTKIETKVLMLTGYDFATAPTIFTLKHGFLWVREARR